MNKNNIQRILYKTKQPYAHLLLAHGAGAGNQHPFMQEMCTVLSELGVQVTSFNFPYMQTMYESGKRKPPNRLPALIDYFESEIARLADASLPLFIGGKSMGGRVASVVNAQHSLVQGTVAFGYPFVPPGKPEKLTERTAHLYEQKSPLLICQGTRDTFGNKSLLADISLPTNVAIQWVEDGDHGFKPRKSSGLSETDNIKAAAFATQQFIQSMLL